MNESAFEIEASAKAVMWLSVAFTVGSFGACLLYWTFGG